MTCCLKMRPFYQSVDEKRGEKFFRQLWDYIRAVSRARMRDIALLDGPIRKSEHKTSCCWRSVLQMNSTANHELTQIINQPPIYVLY